MKRESMVDSQVCHLTFCEASKPSGPSFYLAHSKGHNHGIEVIVLTSFPPCLYGKDNLSLVTMTNSRTYSPGKQSICS